MKLNDGALMNKMSAKMLKLLLCCHPTRLSEYVSCPVASLLCTIWGARMKAAGQPSSGYQAFLDDPSAFNEELGEISFSVMSRSITRRPTQGQSISELSREYRLVSSRIRFAKDMEVDLQSDDFKKPAHGQGNAIPRKNTLSEDSAEIAATTQHFLAVIRALVQGTWRPFKDWGSAAKNKQYMFLTKGPKMRTTQLPKDPLPLWRKSVAGDIRDICKRVQKSIETFYVVEEETKIGRRVLGRHPVDAKLGVPAPPVFGFGPFDADEDPSSGENRGMDDEDDHDDDDDNDGGGGGGMSPIKNPIMKDLRRKRPQSGGGGGAKKKNASKHKRLKKHNLEEAIVGMQVMMLGNWWPGGNKKEKFPGVVSEISDVFEGCEKSKLQNDFRYIVLLDESVDDDVRERWGVRAKDIHRILV